MSAILPFDVESLRRYDRPGPRYALYPAATHFGSDFDETAIREAARLSNGDPIPRRLSLYVRVPDRGRAEPYLSRLVREVAMVAPLFDRDRDVIQLYLRGDAPNFLGTAQLGELMESLSRHFHFNGSSDRDFAVELDPRRTNADDIEALAFMGFNRARLAVQAIGPTGQHEANPWPSTEKTLATIEACRRSNFRSVRVNLVYGLPGQSREGFGHILAAMIAARPDRLALGDARQLPKRFRSHRQAGATSGPSPEDRLCLWQLAIERVSDAGYRYLGLDEFALPEDELSLALDNGHLYRNFIGYMARPETDLLGLGVGALSHIGDTSSQSLRDLPQWEEAIDAGRAPLWRGLRLNADDRLRADLIQQLLCRREIDIPALEERYDIDFSQYFSSDLRRAQPLVADGLVEISGTAFRVTPRGYLLLHMIAACFDGHRHPTKTDLGQCPTAA